MANTFDEKIDYYRNKIENEYMKSATKRNADLISFWREQLDKLEAQPQGKKFSKKLDIELFSKKLYFSSEYLFSR